VSPYHLMGFLRGEREDAYWRVGGLANHPPRTTAGGTLPKTLKTGSQ
jgi:hypothetical protein